MASDIQASAYYKASDWLNNGTLASLKTFSDLNKGNDDAAAAVNDLYYNAASADLQTRSDVNYAKQMIPLSLDFQRGQQQIATSADLTRIGAEGAILSDLTDKQGKYQLENTRLQTDAQRYGFDKGSETAKYTADRGLESTKYTADSQERQIGLEGAQNRLNLQQVTNETLRLRTDARGAVASTGRRFYG